MISGLTFQVISDDSNEIITCFEHNEVQISRLLNISSYSQQYFEEKFLF